MASQEEDLEVRLDDNFLTFEQDHNVLKDDLELLVDGCFKDKWLRNAGGYLLRYGFFVIRLLDGSELYDKARAALSSGTMGQDGLEELLIADSVFLAERRSDGGPVYITCEVSSRLHADDIYRSSKRASAASLLDGTPGVAIAAGASIDDIAAALAEREAVTVVIPQSWRKSA